MNKKLLLIFLSFLVIGFIIYFPGIESTRYGDDFTVVPEGSLKTDMTKIWTTVYQRFSFYRPLEDTITALFIYAFGYNTIPTHILFILLHVFITCIVYYVMVKLKYSPSACIWGSLFFLVAHVNVMTTGGNDTLGQLMCSSFSLVGLWLIYNVITEYDTSHKFNIKKYALVMLLFALSLLCKESSAVFLPLLFTLLLIKNGFSFKGLKRSIVFFIPFVAIFIIFFAIRSTIVLYKPSFGTGVYDFNIGLNIPKNIGALLFAMFLPISSIKTFAAVQAKNYSFLLLALSLTLVYVSIIVYGIFKSKKYKESAVLFCFVIAGFFPYAILNHVNEQYTYFSMPFAAILVGTGLGYLTDNLQKWKRKIIVSVIILFMLMNITVVIEKNVMMSENGIRANDLFGQLKPFFPLIEQNGTLVLVNPPDKGLHYSAFRQPAFELMRYTEYMLYKIAGRNDFKLAVIEPADAEQWKKPGVLMLKLEGDKVVKMN